ncbi:MAG: exo-alpha-sialidase, partial [Planctomycetales bacterium]|nr:exo-alpha-sialidase [Planctomycetales bacterium]
RFPDVPGVVIAHRPQSEGVYIGSPSLVSLGDGALLASHDEFGPKSTEHVRATTHVFRSRDAGVTWSHVATVEGQFWSTLFVHRSAVYLLGVDKHHGNVVIRRSDDEGTSWTSPDAAHAGLIAEGQYHCGPQPILEHDGRLWRAMEDAAGGERWGERYRPLLMSAAIDANLLDRKSWTLTNYVSVEQNWLNGQLRGLLEGNAVKAPTGEVVNILRVAATQSVANTAATLRFDRAAQRLAFDPERDFIEFPGGSKKFTIRYDATSQRYWALTNWVRPELVGVRSASAIRNTLTLVSSADLRRWRIDRVIIQDDDLGHGYQYPDWQIEGDSLIAVVRTAAEDGVGGPHNYHDANFLTFHRIEAFRDPPQELAR